MDEKEVLVLKMDNTTLSMERKRWPREKPRKLFIWWYWYLYYDDSQYKDILFFIWNIWWQNIDKLQVMNCCKNYLYERFVPIP